MEARKRRVVKGTLVTIGVALIIVWAARSFPRSVVFAFGVNQLLILWSHPAFGVFPQRLPAGYYRTRRFEKRGRIYDRLGLGWYRRMLRPILWSVNPARLRSEPGAREKMIQATYDPETGHLIIFLVVMGFTLWAFANRWWDAVAWLLLFNLVHNVYPVMSMRQVRARLRPSRVFETRGS